MPFKGKSVMASPTPGAAGFSLFSHRPHVLVVKNPLQEL